MENKFKQRLCELRFEKGVRQKDLAELLKTTKYTISAWERGICQPSIENIILLAGYFEVSAGYLLGAED